MRHDKESTQERQSQMAVCGCRRDSLSSAEKGITRRLVHKAMAAALRSEGKSLQEVSPDPLSAPLHCS